MRVFCRGQQLFLCCTHKVGITFTESWPTLMPVPTSEWLHTQETSTSTWWEYTLLLSFVPSATSYDQLPARMFNIAKLGRLNCLQHFTVRANEALLYGGMMLVIFCVMFHPYTGRRASIIFLQDGAGWIIHKPAHFTVSAYAGWK